MLIVFCNYFDLTSHGISKNSLLPGMQIRERCLRGGGVME